MIAMKESKQKTKQDHLLQKELKTKCPLCDKKGLRAYRPFCSKRCKDIDLGNWFTGKYTVAGDEIEETVRIEDVYPEESH